MSILKIYFAVSVIGFSAHAADSGLCTDLASYSCSPGVHDDGTGSAQRIGLNAAIRKKIDSLQGPVRKDIETLLKKSDQKFRNLAMTATGLKDAPECNSSVAEEIQNCNQNISEGILQLSITMAGGEGEPFGGDMESTVLLTEDPNFQAISDKIANGGNDKNAMAKNEKKIKDEVLPALKKNLINVISKLHIDNSQKSAIIARVKSVEYGGSKCSSLFTDNKLMENLAPNAFLDPRNLTLNVCPAFFIEGISEFQLAQVLTHEMAHSIDSCSVAYGPGQPIVKYTNLLDPAKRDDEYPIKGLAECLRSSKSIGAELNEKQDPAVFPCSNDQMGEAMADWFSTEVLVDYISEKYPKLGPSQWQNGFANIFRSVCTGMLNSGNESKNFDPHPNIRKRINNLLILNPKVREKMGCTSPHATNIYCDGKNHDSSNNVNQKKSVPGVR